MKINSVAAVLATLAIAAAQHDHGSHSDMGMKEMDTNEMEMKEMATNNATHESSAPPSHSSHPSMDMSSMSSESLNETAIFIAHGADPLSFYEHDYETQNSNSKPGWMIMHAIGMSISFGLLLPIGEPIVFYAPTAQSHKLKSLGIESIKAQPIRHRKSPIPRKHLHFHRLLYYIQKTDA